MIGSGGRGQYHIAQFKEVGAEVAAVCDVYEPNLQAGLKAASTGAKAYTNYQEAAGRQVASTRSLIATPDHWHAQMTIDAVEAGKDVYVEKPMVHKIEEGFRVIEAVRRTKRVVQVGMQRRSYELFQEAKQIMDVGRHRRRPPGQQSAWFNNQSGLRQKKLDGDLDWQQWLGSAPETRGGSARFFNWYYFWDYSGGLMVGQAAHVVDAIHWLMNSTLSVGGDVRRRTRQPGGRRSAGDDVHGHRVSGELSGGVHARLQGDAIRTFNDQIKQFHGNKARFDVGREGYALYPQSNDLDMKPSKQVRRPGTFEPATRAHIRNFLECIKTPQGSERHGRNGEFDGDGAVHGDGIDAQGPPDALGRRRSGIWFEVKHESQNFHDGGCRIGGEFAGSRRGGAVP